MIARPDHALPRFDGLGKPGEGFAEGKDLARARPSVWALASQLLSGHRVSRVSEIPMLFIGIAIAASRRPDLPRLRDWVVRRPKAIRLMLPDSKNRQALPGGLR